MTTEISFIPALPDTWYVEALETSPKCYVFAVHAWMCEVEPSNRNHITCAVPMIQQYISGSLNPASAAQQDPESATVFIGRDLAIKHCHTVEDQDAVFPETGETYPRPGAKEGHVKELVSQLTDDQRLELFGDYCGHCGTKQPWHPDNGGERTGSGCPCWNDE